MASSKWKSWEELALIGETRKLVFWGASQWVTRTLAETSLRPDLIVDTNPENEGVSFEGYKVYQPSVIDEFKKNEVHIVICTGTFKTLSVEFVENGLIIGEDFSVSPFLFDRSKKDSVLDATGKILFSSPEHRLKDLGEGGGLYVLNMADGEVAKVYSGKCRSILAFDHGYACLDMLRGIVTFDHEFNELNVIQVEANSEPHGLAFCELTRRFACGLPGVDGVGVYDCDTGRKIDFFPVSKKAEIAGRDNHHVNDVCFSSGNLLVSMFSMSGNWDLDLYDGGVMQLDTSDGSWFGPLVDDLWMPHSVSIKSGNLLVLDSMRGVLRKGSHSQIFRFPGFLRGLDSSNNGLLVIGVSEHRYPEKVPSSMECVFVTTGILVVDENSKSAKLFNVKNTSSIHDVLFL